MSLGPPATAGKAVCQPGALLPYLERKSLVEAVSKSRSRMFDSFCGRVKD